MDRPKLDVSYSAVRALSVSAYNRGCIWHVSAPHRPCIGHRTGYSLHENARISGLASADFEGFLHTATSGAAPAFLRALRKEEPAKNYYFVPGGIIRKNETIELAFARILRAETGWRASHSDARFLGIFQHFYSTNRFGDPTYGTHYVVLAYELRLDYRPAVVLDAQHSESKWMAEADLISASNVHENTKAYFRKQSPE